MISKECFVYIQLPNSFDNVPDDKVKSRIPRSIENLKKAIPVVDRVALVDNSSSQDPLKTVVRIKDAKVVDKAESLPQWAQELMDELGIK